MRVALNALHLVPRETGGLETYARRLLPALVAAGRGEIELVVLASREGAPSLRAEPWAREAEVVEVPVDARSRARRVLAEQTLLPLAVRRARADLLHNLFNTAPALPPVPQVTTVHDLIYRRRATARPTVMNLGESVVMPIAVRRSRRIIAISRASRNDLVELLRADPERVDVVLNGPGRGEVPAPVPAVEVRDRFGIGERPFVLTVSAKLPHKNVDRLIEAVAGMDGDGAPVLLVPGYETRLEGALRELVESRGAAERIRFAGWVDDATLDGLYRACDAFVFPSLAEGFGAPVLEAMERGVPTACSNTTSLPEVAGDAALLFDPTDTAAIAATVERMLSDESLRERLRRAGPEQARRFSWERTAAGTIATYRRALAE